MIKIQTRSLWLICFLFMYQAIQAQVPVNINSGNPAFPFPQFLDYGNDRQTLASHNPTGVTHAEMEQRARDAWQIYANSFVYTGQIYSGVKYVKANADCPYDCSEGDGYALLGAAYMGDKATFDGLWFRTHDLRRATKKTYTDCSLLIRSGYKYGDNSLVEPGTDVATDGSMDIAMALLMAWKQWGDNSGYNDACGDPISYKKEALEVIRGLVELHNGVNLPADCRRTSGVIGIDGYFKNGNTWGELSLWANGKPICPEFTGPQSLYVDYMAPAYTHAFADFLQAQGTAEDLNWNIPQLKKSEASSDWIMGKFLTTPNMIPFAGKVSLTDTTPAFSNFSTGEDFRTGWRTILNYVWHGNSSSTWNPSLHTIVNKPNNFERDIAFRFAKFLKKPQDVPWNNPCDNSGSGFNLTFNGPSTLKPQYSTLGVQNTTLNNNWLQGTGSPSAVASQDFDLMAKMFRQCVLEWDTKKTGDGYLTSEPMYFHGWFRLLGMLVLTGNAHTPANMVPKANLKVYHGVDKTSAYPGDLLTYTVKYRNYGSVTASGVILSTSLPAGLQFVSASNGGVISGNNVSWNIGSVPGFTTSNGIAPTQGQLTLVVKVKPFAGRICNTFSITLSNGTGWTSNEFPNNQTSVMERNCTDIIQNQLFISKTADKQTYKTGDQATFTLKFENKIPASWLNGGRPGVNLSFATGALTNPAASSILNLKVRLFHDADEAYINYGNYRFSYFLFDNVNNCYVKNAGCTSGWDVTNEIAEGFDQTKVSITQENISPGSDGTAKWNQRIIFRFPGQLAATTQHLTAFYGIPSRIHEGASYPLRGTWRLNQSTFFPLNLIDDWSYDATIEDQDGGLYFPVGDDFTDVANPGSPVTSWHKSACQTSPKISKKVLVEEWDGYTWRRVFGNGPISARDISNVVITDTLPAGFTFKSFVRQNPLGINATSTSLPGGKTLVKWSISKLIGNLKDSIVYTATVNAICPAVNEQLISNAAISGDEDSRAVSSTIVTLNCTVTGLDSENENAGLDVFPNPAKDVVHISGLSDNASEKITFKDMKGNVLKEQTSAIGQEMDISSFQNGVYFIEVSSANSTRKIKLLILK